MRQDLGNEAKQLQRESKVLKVFLESSMEAYVKLAKRRMHKTKNVTMEMNGKE